MNRNQIESFRVKQAQTSGRGQKEWGIVRGLERNRSRERGGRGVRKGKRVAARGEVKIELFVLLKSEIDNIRRAIDYH